MGAVVPYEVIMSDIGFTLMAIRSRLDSSSSFLCLFSTAFGMLRVIIRTVLTWARLALDHLVSPGNICSRSSSRYGTYSFPVPLSGF